ncbi:hypothetical protein Q3G72_028211 [Acer saccharum]|nr:hypothetical protein Q3G72_028211 [Acer saccharum]
MNELNIELLSVIQKFKESLEKQEGKTDDNSKRKRVEQRTYMALAVEFDKCFSDGTGTLNLSNLMSSKCLFDPTSNLTPAGEVPL